MRVLPSISEKNFCLHTSGARGQLRRAMSNLIVSVGYWRRPALSAFLGQSGLETALAVNNTSPLRVMWSENCRRRFLGARTRRLARVLLRFRVMRKVKFSEMWNLSQTMESAGHAVVSWFTCGACG